MLFCCVFTFNGHLAKLAVSALCVCVFIYNDGHYFVRRGLHGHSGRGFVRLADVSAWSESGGQVTWVDKRQTAGERETERLIEKEKCGFFYLYKYQDFIIDFSINFTLIYSLKVWFIFYIFNSLSSFLCLFLSL